MRACPASISQIALSLVVCERKSTDSRAVGAQPGASMGQIIRPMGHRVALHMWRAISQEGIRLRRPPGKQNIAASYSARCGTPGKNDLLAKERASIRPPRSSRLLLAAQY